MPVPVDFDPCKYVFWPQGASGNIFVDPETKVIGYDWTVGATVSSDLKMAIPSNWMDLPLVAISFDENCEEQGYRYANWEEMAKDINSGKLKAVKGSLDGLAKLLGGSGKEGQLGIGEGNPGWGQPWGIGEPDPDDDGKKKKFPLWAKIALVVVAYKVITD
jgi:hypothetical protein